jgi:hypothetical protein
VKKKKKSEPVPPEQVGMDFDAPPIPPPSQAVPVRSTVRNTDPGTSYAAATSLPAIGRRGCQRAKLAHALYRAQNGMTYEEAAKAAGIGFQSCPWKRLQELSQLGWAEVAGERTGSCGQPQQVYRLTGAGRKYWPEVERELLL